MTRILMLALMTGMGAGRMGAQAPGPTPPTAGAAATAAGGAISMIVRPGLEGLGETLDTVRLEKWKGSNEMRGEMDGNLRSIRGDLQGALPGLMATADGEPGSLVKVLPVFRNMDALYDVLLRVSETAQVVAPKPQSEALARAMAKLEGSRRALGDHLQEMAVTQERTLVETAAALRARPVATPAAAAAPVVRVTPPVTHTARRRRAKAKVVTPDGAAKP